MAVVLAFLFGTSRGIFCAHVLAAMARLCPCPVADAACEAHHRRAAAAIVLAVEDEVPPCQRAALLADPVAAARRALRLARGGLLAYAGGHQDAALELARYVVAARWALAASR